MHDLGLTFNSPFVNLWMTPTDYLKMLGDLRGYLSSELEKIDDESVAYPVGILKDVKIYFQHYSSFDEAKMKWESRIKRINWNKVYVLFTDRDGCTIDMLKGFDELPFKK